MSLALFFAQHVSNASTFNFRSLTKLPAGDKVTSRQLLRCVNTTSCKHSLMLLRMSEIIARNMLS